MALSPVLGKLLHKRVVLASASPRRQEILSNAGLRFEVVPSRFKEKLSKSSFPSPYAYAMETAKQKALEVATRLHQKDLRIPDVVIGADTIVAVDGLILEKPVDKQDAYRMLSRLSGKQHSVFTGVCIVHCYSRDGELETEVSEFYEETQVKFSELSEELLWEYIHSGEPMDKAGGYGIQALGGMLVEAVRGDFLNVVGFPLNHFCKRLAGLYLPCVDGSEDLSDGPRDTQPASPAGLLQLVRGFKALVTACKLRVFDVLQDGAAGSAVEVARKVGASVGRTRPLLDACVGLGLLQRTGRGYRNAEAAAEFLVSEGERSLHGYVLHSGAQAQGTQAEAPGRAQVGGRP